MPISDLLAQISGETQSPVTMSIPVQKRKADDDLRRANDKLVRRDQPVAASSTTIAQVKKVTNSPAAIPNSKSNTATSTTSRVNPPTFSNGSSQNTASTDEPSKTPKKGSYAEIIARAKAAQVTHGQVGKIQHKRIEKSLSKRERQELKEQESKSHRPSKKSSQTNMRTHTRDGRSGTRQTSGKGDSKTQALPEKKIKKAALATTGYTGTARPNPAAVKSSKLVPPSRATGRDGYGRSSSLRKEAYVTEDEEDEEDEEEEDGYSDASSDMEAAVFEVDEEEERATRIARKEDEEALRLEARLKREKEEKRRRLADLAKIKR